MRNYVRFDFDAPYKPVPGLWFECLRCGGVVRSLPKLAWHCECGDVSMDVAQCVFEVADPARVRAFYREDDAE